MSMRARQTGTKLLVMMMGCLAVFGGCATTQVQLARTKSGFDEVYRACIDATSEIKFGVSSSDPKTGLIVAEQAVVLGQGTVSKLNVTVTRVGDGTEVRVSFVPPPLTVGGQGVVEDYLKALRKRVPDIQVVTDE